MGNFANCCHAESDRSDEIMTVSAPDSFAKGQEQADTSARLAEDLMVKSANGEWQHTNLSSVYQHDSTQISSFNKSHPTIVKKVLQYKVFKSLKKIKNISARYEIGKMLGKGSFGEVLTCKNKLSGQECAIKIVKKEKIFAHQVLIDLMESELDILSKTEHPNIVRVLELLEDELHYYIVSELVSGGELYDYIIKHKIFDEGKSADLIKQILLAVNYMHQ